VFHRDSRKGLDTLFSHEIFSNNWCSQIFKSTFVVFVNTSVCGSAVERISVDIYKYSLKKSGTNFISKLMEMSVYLRWSGVRRFLNVFARCSQVFAEKFWLILVESIFGPDRSRCSQMFVATTHRVPSTYINRS